jgi:hypothetical protein
MENVKVQSVKLGDVLFYLDNKIDLLSALLNDDEKSEVYYINEDNNNMKEYTQGRVSARKSDLGVLADLRNSLTNLK